jgi:hypothetical protein
MSSGIRATAKTPWGEGVSLIDENTFSEQAYRGMDAR